MVDKSVIAQCYSCNNQLDGQWKFSPYSSFPTKGTYTGITNGYFMSYPTESNFVYLYQSTQAQQKRTIESQQSGLVQHQKTIESLQSSLAQQRTEVQNQSQQLAKVKNETQVQKQALEAQIKQLQDNLTQVKSQHNILQEQYQKQVESTLQLQKQINDNEINRKFVVHNHLECQYDLLLEIYGFLQSSPSQRLKEKMSVIQKETQVSLEKIESVKQQFMQNIDLNPGLFSIDKFMQAFQENIDTCQNTVSQKFMEYYNRLDEIIQPQDHENVSHIFTQI
eukprot:403332458